MEDLLKQIVKSKEHKTSFQIIVSDSKSRFKTIFNPTLQLDRDQECEIALVNLETYYSFPNIDETNNVFVYSPDNGNSWKKIKIPERSYEIDDINNTIHHEMEKSGHHDLINEDYYINISANSNTLKSVLILERDYQVDFNNQNSIAKVLGFTGAKYTEGFYASENVVNILSINSTLVIIIYFDIVPMYLHWMKVCNIFFILHTLILHTLELFSRVLLCTELFYIPSFHQKSKYEQPPLL